MLFIKSLMPFGFFNTGLGISSVFRANLLFSTLEVSSVSLGVIEEKFSPCCGRAPLVRIALDESHNSKVSALFKEGNSVSLSLPKVSWSGFLQNSLRHSFFSYSDQPALISLILQALHRVFATLVFCRVFPSQCSSF